MKVETDVEQTDVEGDYGPVDGVQVTCRRCGHIVESGGTGEASLKRCGALLGEECPRGEKNFYVVED